LFFVTAVLAPTAMFMAVGLFAASWPRRGATRTRSAPIQRRRT
jgi:hypothetical protein